MENQLLFLNILIGVFVTFIIILFVLITLYLYLKIKTEEAKTKLELKNKELEKLKLNKEFVKEIHEFYTAQKDYIGFMKDPNNKGIVPESMLEKTNSVLQEIAAGSKSSEKEKQNE